MSDIITDTVRETGTVVTELVAKAKEARAAGRSRRDFFASTAKLAGATALGAAGIDLLQPIAARAATHSRAAMPSADTVQDILNIACTAESLAITFYYHALIHTAILPDVNSPANRNYFQAALTQEAEHLYYLESLGGKTLANQFYFPAGMFTNQSVFFPTSMLLEEYFISAYIAAALDFSGAYSSNITAASPVLIGTAVQICGVECEHRALLRVAANLNPPNNVVAESALVPNVLSAVGPLTSFLSGGSGFDTTPIPTPIKDAIGPLAAPYGFSFFPKPVFI
jgi:rubrerythrin